jgi:hypothetical protein
MNRALLILTLATVSACSTPQSRPKLAQPRSILPSEYVSPDSTLLVRFHVCPRHSYYEVSDRSGITHQARAQSLIVADDLFEGRFRGTQDVTFANDGSGVAITEDVSDASPSLQHILFSRQPGGFLGVRYLLPPWRQFTTDPRAEFTSELPVATALTADSITFYYPSSRATCTLPLAQVSSTATPKLK